MVMLARKIGKNIIPVVEKFTELEADRQVRRGARASGRSIGVRVKLAAAAPAAGGPAPATAPSSA